MGRSATAHDADVCRRRNSRYSALWAASLCCGVSPLPGMLPTGWLTAAGNWPNYKRDRATTTVVRPAARRTKSKHQRRRRRRRLWRWRRWTSMASFSPLLLYIRSYRSASSVTIHVDEWGVPRWYVGSLRTTARSSLLSRRLLMQGEKYSELDQSGKWVSERRFAVVVCRSVYWQQQRQRYCRRHRHPVSSVFALRFVCSSPVSVCLFPPVRGRNSASIDNSRRLLSSPSSAPELATSIAVADATIALDSNELSIIIKTTTAAARRRIIGIYIDEGGNLVSKIWK